MGALFTYLQIVLKCYRVALKAKDFLQFSSLLPGHNQTALSHPQGGSHMRSIFTLILFVTLIFSNIFSQGTFRLESELRTNYSDGSTTKILTHYTYDANGIRIDKKAYNGADTLSSLMSATEYTYNASSQLAEELLLAGTDTLCIIRYGYSGTNLVSVRTLKKDGSLRFMDSLVYNTSGQIIDECRYTTAGMTFYHRYSYNTAGLKVSDTLYEKSGTAFVPKQAVLFAYNPDNTVSSEANYRETAGSWFLICTVKMAYSSGLLSSATEYEGDGTSNKVLDSLALSYDGNGNRIREENYNDEKELVYTIDYTWVEIVGIISQHHYKQKKVFTVMHNGRILKISAPEQTPVTFSLYDLRGRLIHGVEKTLNRTVLLPCSISAGTYIAQIAIDNNRQTIHFTINN